MRKSEYDSLNYSVLKVSLLIVPCKYSKVNRIKMKLKYCHFIAHNYSAPVSEQTVLLCFHTLCLRDFTILAKIRELVHL